MSCECVRVRGMSRSVVFYSRDCFHSAEALKTASRLPDAISTVCVDDVQPGQLPPFVTHVPMMITPDRRVLSGDSLFHFLEILGNAIAAAAPGAAAPRRADGEGESPPVSDPWMAAAGAGGNTPYSWVETGDAGTPLAGSGSLYETLDGQGGRQSHNQQHQSHQQHAAHHDPMQHQYRPLNMHQPPSIPGRGMATLAIGGNGAGGVVPERLMPDDVSNRRQSSSVSMETLLALRDADEERWKQGGQPMNNGIS